MVNSETTQRIDEDTDAIAGRQAPFLINAKARPGNLFRVNSNIKPGAQVESWPARSRPDNILRIAAPSRG